MSVQRNIMIMITTAVINIAMNQLHHAKCLATLELGNSAANRGFTWS
jgi:hypothetical protein